ncbi:hypothetical protein HAX54_011842 [Datura stramonium]|uniref:Uncharacterized protein n=1 Tax=Datura stramonium TaxID=4076 RepID=A0ABS8RX88_DATST|nr:hypothetical protein [Datura stramonium]
MVHRYSDGPSSSPSSHDATHDARTRDPYLVDDIAIETSTPALAKVANMTAWNNTKLTSFIEHILERIKGSIDKDFALVHATIQNLEQRVSALKGIGADDTIATL